MGFKLLLPVIKANVNISTYMRVDLSMCINVYQCIYVCVYIHVLKIQVHNVTVHMCTYMHVYIYLCTNINKYVPYLGRPTRKSCCVLAMTGSVSLEMLVMEPNTLREQVQVTVR